MREHEAAFGKDCLACHDGSGRTAVDHSKFAFKLTGKHAGVPCERLPLGRPVAAGLPAARRRTATRATPRTTSTTAPTAGTAASCHSADGWDDVTFDHKVFPLDHGSEEQKATCQTCHPDGTDTYTCYGCHEHTTANVVGEHEGKSLAELTDCVRCHQKGRGGGD